jgi:MoaA/NifB/PqqE/SkfB family radical SAM enzyme
MKFFRQPYLLNIDLLGVCNLKCPSCPTGRRENGIVKGTMAPETLEAILQKADKECIIHSIGLINWTEPTLHPKLGEMVRIAKKYCKNVGLSTNLNYDADFESILKAEPSNLRVSLSGFTQEVYKKGHRGGDIEVVKDNLKKLIKHNVSTDIAVYWHNYNDNAHEKQAMKDLAASLGIGFHESNAILMPVEEVMKVWRSDREQPVTTDVGALLPRLLEGMPHAKADCSKHKSIHCSLQTRQLAIDSEGNVSVCCASYNTKLNLVGNFLALPLKEIERRKNDSAFCRSCKEIGAHVYVLYLRNWKDRMKSRMAHVYCGIRRHSV